MSRADSLIATVTSHHEYRTLDDAEDAPRCNLQSPLAPSCNRYQRHLQSARIHSERTHFSCLCSVATSIPRQTGSLPD